MLARLLAVLSVCLGVALPPAPAEAASAELQVVYPRIDEHSADDYGYAVLELALARSGQPYRLSVSTARMNQERARSEMEAGRISVMDFGTGAAYEARFRAVYFPIDRGLSGYRLAIIRRHRAGDFAMVRTLGDLRAMAAGQGTGWADSRILEAAGIPVRSAEFDQLFRMVEAGRFDFFPLGVEEVYGLLDRFQGEAPNAVVEDTLVLHYPFARLFFVRKDDARLHDAISLGLQRAFADGSFQRLLENHPRVKASLQRAGLRQRTMIEIDNPFLTPAFRAIPAQYFYRP